MRRYPLALLAAMALALIGDHAVLAQRPTQICEPGRDKRNPDLERAKEAKKAQMRAAGYPDRFLKLIDREECIDCVKEASDGFGIMIVYKDNAYAPTDPKTGNKWTHITYRWDPESEVIAREKTRDGTIKGFYILNTSKHDCKCCPEIDDDSGPQDRSDWDPEIEANKSHLIPFDQSNVTGPLPDDLVNPSDKWVGDPVPNIETFQKPPKKQAHARCTACDAAAQALNDAYDALDVLWDQKITLLNGMSILDNTVAKRDNDLALMHYKQRSTLTRTPERDQQIAEAERANEADNAALRNSAAAVERLEARITAAAAGLAPLEKALVDCEARCATTETIASNATNTSASRPADPPAASVTPATPPPVSTGCFGDSCGDNWSSCEVSGTCPSVEEDCGIPGVCTDGPTPDGPAGLPLINLIEPGAWTTSVNIEIEIRIQEKLVDLFDPANFPQYAQPFAPDAYRDLPTNASSVVIPAIQPQGVRQWFNPLGLLARRLADNLERWRGSIGPRPLINARDLELVDRYSGAQSGLPRGVHVLLSDQGGSTGKTLAMQILNLSGRPVRLSSKPFAVQPIKQQAQPQVQQAFSRLAKAAPVRLDLSAYCVEFLKAPPGPNTLLRLAPSDVQKKYASLSKILQSGYRVAHAKSLRPDSNPAAYTDSIKQWAIWAVEQKLNESRYTEAFIGHTRKNVEAAGQQWSKPAEDMVRKVSPNRWRDIVKVLRGAGVPVPQ